MLAKKTSGFDEKIRLLRLLSAIKPKGHCAVAFWLFNCCYQPKG